jgi:hypothetical protein
LSPALRKILVPLFVVDAVFVVALFYWIFSHQHRKDSTATTAKPDMRIELRQLEPKLTEIDLVNRGGAAGSLDLAADISWQDADLDQTKALADFDEIDTGRTSVRFHPHVWPSGAILGPGESRDIGWVKLKDDSPLHAEMVTGPAATQP